MNYIMSSNITSKFCNITEKFGDIRKLMFTKNSLCYKIFPNGPFHSGFCDIRKLMFTKFCDISSHNDTICKWTTDIRFGVRLSNMSGNLSSFKKYFLVMSSTRRDRYLFSKVNFAMITQYSTHKNY